MLAKIQKEFTLIIGTNDIKVKEEDLDIEVTILEQFANSNFSSLKSRIHIVEKEQHRN